jgi:hypothetical protein
MSTIFSKKESTLSENSGIYFGVNSLRQAIADVIRRRMRELGDLNPNQVAKRVSGRITPAGVRNILKAESGVMVESLVVVADALETTAPELLIEAMRMSEGNVSALSDVRVARMAEKIAGMPVDVQKILEVQVNSLSRTFNDNNESNVANGPARVATSLDAPHHEDEQPILPAKKRA